MRYSLLQIRLRSRATVMHIVMEEMISPSSMITGICKIIHVKVCLCSLETQKKEVEEGVLQQTMGPRGKAGNQTRSKIKGYLGRTNRTCTPSSQEIEADTKSVK